MFTYWYSVLQSSWGAAAGPDHGPQEQAEGQRVQGQLHAENCLLIFNFFLVFYNLRGQFWEGIKRAGFYRKGNLQVNFVSRGEQAEMNIQRLNVRIDQVSIARIYYRSGSVQFLTRSGSLSKMVFSQMRIQIWKLTIISHQKDNW